MTLRGKKSTELKKYSEKKSWKKKIDRWLDFGTSANTKHIRITKWMFKMGQHWVHTLTGKQYPVWCTKFDSNEEVFDTARCCPAHDVSIPCSIKLIGQCIDREAQRNGDPNPVFAFEFPGVTIGGFLDEINSILQEKNPDACYDHDDFGCDIRITRDGKKAGALIWSLQKDDGLSPLTSIEKNYNYYSLENIIPDFGDTAVAEELNTEMKRGLVTHKYFVVKISEFMGGDPLNCFKGSDDGKPYLEFPELTTRYPKNNNNNKKSNYQQPYQQQPYQQQPYQQQPYQQQPYQQQPQYSPPQPQYSPQPQQQPQSPQPQQPQQPQPQYSPQPQPQPQPPQPPQKPNCFGKYDSSTKCHACVEKVTCMMTGDDMDL